MEQIETTDGGEKRDLRCPANSPMLLPIGIEYRSRNIVNWLRPRLGLAHFLPPTLMSDQMTINITPCRYVGEAQMFRCNSHYRPVLFVESLLAEGLCAGYHLPCLW